MNLKLKATLITSAFFVGVILFSIGLHAVAPYLQPWMGYAAILAALFYAMYSLILVKLEMDSNYLDLDK